MRKSRSKTNNVDLKRFALDFDYIRAESQVRLLKKYYEKYGVDIPLKSVRLGNDVLIYLWEREGHEPVELYRVNFRKKDLITLQLELITALDMYMKIEKLAKKGWSYELLLRFFKESKANNFSIILIERNKDRLEFYRGLKFIGFLGR